MAGVLLGLLSFKPHLGVLIPLVLIVSGRWRVIAAATVTTVLLAAASWFAFGSGPWEAFIRALLTASQSTLSEGRTDWWRLQSIFGLVRMLGGGETLAWTLQLVVAGSAAILLCVLWRSRVRFDLKAAGLATGILLATPYIFLYDLVILAVAMAFLLRDMQDAGARSGDMLGLAGAAALHVDLPAGDGARRLHGDGGRRRAGRAARHDVRRAGDGAGRRRRGRITIGRRSAAVGGQACPLRNEAFAAESALDPG